MSHLGHLEVHRVEKRLSADALRAFALFKDLTAFEREEIAAELPEPIRYGKGESVYRTDAFRRAIGLLADGSVTICTPEEDGHSVIMNRLGAGDMFGAAALFDTESTYVTHITAEEESRIVFLSQETMTAWLPRFPRLAENYIRFLSGRIRFLNRKLAVLTSGSASTRLYHYLLAHQDEAGWVQMPRSMVELANSLNIGRSSLYRALESLQSTGVLSCEQRRYRLIT